MNNNLQRIKFIQDKVKAIAKLKMVVGEIWSQKALAFCESPIAKAIRLRLNNLMFGLNNRFNPLPKKFNHR